MARTVFFTTVAARDLIRSQEWLSQPGSGKRSKSIAKKLLRAASLLVETAGSHPKDRFSEGSHQLVVDDYVIRYFVVANQTEEQVWVERIYGPGQDRSS